MHQDGARCRATCRLFPKPSGVEGLHKIGWTINPSHLEPSFSCLLKLKQVATCFLPFFRRALRTALPVCEFILVRKPDVLVRRLLISH